MYYNLVVFQIVVVLVTYKINFIASLSERNFDKITQLKIPWHPKKYYGFNDENLEKNEQSESHIDQKNKNDENNLDSKDENNNPDINGKMSRVELLFGTSGLKILSSSSVLVLGVNQLSIKIITHLIRSGVGSIAIWDDDNESALKQIREIVLLNPDAHIAFIKKDPVTALKEFKYSTVILCNQPLSLAYELNKKYHKRCNFVYTSVAGTYGFVLNDFGKHKVTIPSDDPYPEYSCSLIHSGDQTCLEVNTSSNISNFQINDTVEVKYRNRSNQGSLYTIQSNKYKILNVVKSKNNKTNIWISTNDNKIDGDVVSIRRVDDEVVVNFKKFEKLINSLINLNWFQKSVKLLLKKDNKDKKDDILVLSPTSGNMLNEKSLSVLSSFLTMNKTNLLNLDKDYELDVHNFYSIAKKIYPNSDFNVISNFNTLKKVIIPPVNSLVGALAAQEAIKGITHMFTPSKLILVDRSDLFADESGNVDPDKVKYSVDQVSKLSYLLIGSGALGCDYLKLLAEMGVKDVTVVDNDVVDVSNLSRQVLFTVNDIGKPKAQSALRNLSQFHDIRGYKHYNMLFDEKSFDLLDLKENENKNIVAISAVDNMEGRVALDNYCVQNNIPLVESGIHGMKCSTSFTFPRITESFSSSMGDKPLSIDKYSCSVKGIPTNIDDCVFYSIELFNWIFNTQHMMFNNFLYAPVVTLKKVLLNGPDNLYNIIQIIYENMEILNSDNENELANRLKTWAERTYDKYIGYEYEFKDLMIKNLMHLKIMSLKFLGIGSNTTGIFKYDKHYSEPVNDRNLGDSGKNGSSKDSRGWQTSYSGCCKHDYNDVKTLLNKTFEHPHEFGNNNKNVFNNKTVDKKTFFKVIDEFSEKFNNTNSNGNTRGSGKSRNDRSYRNNTNDSEEFKLFHHLDHLGIEEDSKYCNDFIFLVSNLRARRFNIPEADRTTLIQKAKNIVPAVSTCVSVAASLSLMELYKLHLVDKSKLDENSFIKDFKKNHSKHLVMKDNELFVGDNVKLNDEVNLIYSVSDSHIKFYNNDKLILSLESFDYEKHKNLANIFNNYFFNTATLKFTSNITDPPKVFKIENENSILNGLSLSYWDYLFIKEPSKNVINELISKNRLFGFNKTTSQYIYLYELVDILEYIFDVEVDALTYKDGYVLVKDSNKSKRLKDLIKCESGDLILHIIARDSNTNKMIELPDVKYTR